MIRLLAKYQMRRSLDYDRSLPLWVQRRLTVDPQLDDYWCSLQSLENRLRAGAPAWLDQQKIDLAFKNDSDRNQTVSKIQLVGKRSLRQAQVAMALCAAVLIAVSIALWNPDFLKSNPISTENDLAHVASNDSKTQSSLDQESLETAKANARKLIQQASSINWKERFELLRGERRPPSMEQVYLDQTGLDQLAAQTAGGLRQCVEVAGNSTGQMVRSLESGILHQKNHISSSFRSSMDSAGRYWLAWTARIGDSMGQTP